MTDEPTYHYVRGAGWVPKIPYSFTDVKGRRWHIVERTPPNPGDIWTSGDDEETPEQLLNSYPYRTEMDDYMKFPWQKHNALLYSRYFVFERVT